MNVGPERWLLSRYGKLSGVWLHASDLKSAKYGNLPSFVGTQRIGIAKDAEFDVSALTPQPGYTPYVQAIKDHRSTYARSGLDVTSTVRLRKEAAIQGVKSVKAWDCSLQCYDQRLVDRRRQGRRGPVRVGALPAARGGEAQQGAEPDT